MLVQQAFRSFQNLRVYNNLLANALTIATLASDVTFLGNITIDCNLQGNVNTSGNLNVGGNLVVAGSTTLGAITNLATIAGAQVTNLKFVNANVTSNSTGDLDMYTVPANRAALISGMHCFNSTANSISAYGEIKVGGIYYGLAGSVTIPAGSSVVPGNDTLFAPIILTAGQTLSIHTGTNAGLTTWASVWEFDAGSNIKTAVIFPTNGVSGNYVLYSAPAGKTAKVLMESWIADSSVLADADPSLFAYGGISGSTSTNYLYIVPNGSSPSTTNQALAASTLNVQQTTRINLTCALGSGDNLVVNTTASANQMMFWVNLLEYA